MPIYHYKCNKCGLDLELNRKVEDRDDLNTIMEEYCPVWINYRNFLKRHNILPTESLENYCNFNEFIPDTVCELKRVPTLSSFKI